MLCFKNPNRVSRISTMDVTDHNKNFCSYCSLYLPDFRAVLRSDSAIFVHTMYVTELDLTLWDIAPFCVIAASRDRNDSQISESWLIPKPNKVLHTHSALHMWGVIVVKCRDVINEGCTPTRLHDVTFRMTVLLKSSPRESEVSCSDVARRHESNLCNSSANRGTLMLVHLRN